MAREIRWIGGRLVPALAVAFLVSHLIRAHLLEWYRVPSQSMEPTLHGDPVHGDVVLVDKTAFWFAEPDRFDLVVLRDSEDPRAQLVKRLIASGDDTASVVALDAGDVFVGPTRQSLERVVKQPDRARPLRIPHFRFPENGATPVESYFHPSPAWQVGRADGPPALTLAPAAADPSGLARLLDADRQRARRTPPSSDPYLRGHLSTAEPVDARYLDVDGELRGRAETCTDAGLELLVEPAPGWTGLQLVYEHRDAYYALQIDAAGGLRFVVGGTGAAEGAVGVYAPRLAPGKATEVAFGYLDGYLFAEVDRRVVWRRRCELAPPGPSAYPTPGLPGLLHVATAGAPLLVRRIEVFHDVYYRPLAALYAQAPPVTELQPGELFLLGDNTFDSRDSRTGRTFRRVDLLGRPLAVLAPPARRRWLTR